jgi:hypothetical protein
MLMVITGTAVRIPPMNQTNHHSRHIPYAFCSLFILVVPIRVHFICIFFKLIFHIYKRGLAVVTAMHVVLNGTRLMVASTGF